MTSLRDAFLFKGSDGPKMHLAAVITDPAKHPNGTCAVVLFSTNEPHKEQTCPVEPQEHPFIKEPSLVEFVYTRLMSAAGIDTFLQQGRYKPQSSISAGLYGRIVEKLRVTKELSGGTREFLAQQGLLP